MSQYSTLILYVIKVKDGVTACDIKEAIKKATPISRSAWILQDCDISIISNELTGSNFLVIEDCDFFDKWNDFDVLLEALSPYLEKAQVEFVAEDGSLYGYKLENGQVRALYGRYLTMDEVILLNSIRKYDIIRRIVEEVHQFLESNDL